MARNDRVIVWRITQDCNLRCSFCSYSCDVERQRENADPEQINRFIDVVGKYKAETGENVLVSWIGGEPFLHSDIMRLSERLYSLGINVSATTNGMLLTKETLTDIDRYFSEIVFSLDSFEECDNAVRQCKNHFKTVSDKIMQLDRIRKLNGSSLKIKVNTILMRRNIEMFNKFCDYLLSIGVDEVTFNRLGGYDRPEFFSENRLLYSQSKKFADEFPMLRKNFYDKGLIVHGSRKYMDRFMTAALDKPNFVEECNPGEWFWFINENGYISPCSYTSYEYKFPVDDVKTTEDFERVERYFRLQRRNCRSKWCDNCFCTQVYDKFE